MPQFSENGGIIVMLPTLSLPAPWQLVLWVRIVENDLRKWDLVYLFANPPFYLEILLFSDAFLFAIMFHNWLKATVMS